MKNILCTILLMSCLAPLYCIGAPVDKNTSAIVSDTFAKNTASYKKNELEKVVYSGSDNYKLIMKSYYYNIMQNKYDNAQVLLIKYNKMCNNMNIPIPQEWSQFIDKEYNIWKHKVTIEPKNADAYVILSALEYNKGNKNKALYYSQVAKSLNPDEYFRTVARLYFFTGNIQMAEQECIEQLQIHKNDDFLFNMLSFVYIMKNNLPSALKYSDKIINKPYSPYKSGMIGSIYLLLKRNNAGLYQILPHLISQEEQLKNKKYDIEYLDLAVFMIDNGENGVAVEMVKDSAKINPANYNYYLYIAQKLLQVNDKERAKIVLSLVSSDKLSPKAQSLYTQLKKELV